MMKVFTWQQVAMAALVVAAIAGSAFLPDGEGKMFLASAGTGLLGLLLPQVGARK